MIFGSICSGVEAASAAWVPLGWKCAFVSEIDRFPSAVLAHHYPDVPNLGDMTAIDGRDWRGKIDVLVGGTPCQSFSIAGNRQGKSDPRGQLTFSFLHLVDEVQPEWVVWENVPGILSLNRGKDFGEFLAELLRLGYIVNCDILDAQFFGLAQRRRRVFVICQRADFLMRRKTLTSSLTLAKVAGEISLNILDDLMTGLGKEPTLSDSLQNDADVGLVRKMKPYLKHGDGLFLTWLKNSIDFLQNVQLGQKNSDCLCGQSIKMAERTVQTEMDTSSLSIAVQERYHGQSFSTEGLPKKCSGDLFSLVKLFTTSTDRGATTEKKISMCLRALAIIAKLITPLRNYNNLCQNCSQILSMTESSILTALKESINYARRSNDALFDKKRLFIINDNLIREAEQLRRTFEYPRDGTDPSQILFEFDGVRRDSPPCREARKDAAGSIPTGPGRRRGGGDKPHVLAFGGNNTNGPIDVATACNAHGGRMDFESETFVLDSAVRRLTPRERERLMGFPDDYTLIPYRGKPACDGPRYKALGNSMAVPGMRWIGERIDKA